MTSPRWVVLLIVLTLLVGAGWVGLRHAGGHRRYMVSAVTRHMDAHTPQIARLLVSMRGSDASPVEEAAYQELRGMSLFERSMVRVSPTADGSLECVIDPSSLGVAPRTIRASAVTPP